MGTCQRRFSAKQQMSAYKRRLEKKKDGKQVRERKRENERVNESEYLVHASGTST